MAFKCGFFTSVNGDRTYGVDDISRYITGIVSEGIVADDKYSDGLQVVAGNGLEVIVKKGNGLFFGKWCENEYDEPFTIPLPHVTDTRIDSIVIHIDKTDGVRDGWLEYKQGMDGNPPELIDDVEVKEFRLCNITVAPNARSISQDEIEDTRPTRECGIVSNLLQNSDITATYKQWQAQFEKWFSNVKETLATSTLISSFNSKYITEYQDETLIPIGIPQYRSATDILQVYINGLYCFENEDYTVNDFESITLTKGVDPGTNIYFIVYKSQDGSEVQKYESDLDEMRTQLRTVDNEVDALKLDSVTHTSQMRTINDEVDNIDKRVLSMEAFSTETPLWTGANIMGSGASIKPSKKLSECKNGYIVVWTGYNTGSGASNTRFQTFMVHKGMLSNIPLDRIALYCPLVFTHYDTGNYEQTMKQLLIYDDRIEGFAGNDTDSKNRGMCLKFVFEF
jgi:hypothetical protein